MHKGALLHKDNFAKRVTSAQVEHFLNYFNIFINLVFFSFIFTITVTPNPYPQSVTFFWFFY